MRAMAIDSCHDRGGSWHYDVESCSFTENYRGDRSADKDAQTLADNALAPEGEARIRQFQITRARDLALQSGLSESMFQARVDICVPKLETALAECDDALAGASNDAETVELHPYCLRLSRHEFVQCLNGIEP